MDTQKIPLLIQKLQVKQQERNLSDADFANLLNLSRAGWQAIVRRKRQPGRKFLTGVVLNYPDLGEVVLEYLRTADFYYSNF